MSSLKNVARISQKSLSYVCSRKHQKKVEYAEKYAEIIFCINFCWVSASSKGSVFFGTRFFLRNRRYRLYEICCRGKSLKRTLNFDWSIWNWPIFVTICQSWAAWDYWAGFSILFSLLAPESAPRDAQPNIRAPVCTNTWWRATLPHDHFLTLNVLLNLKFLILRA